MAYIKEEVLNDIRSRADIVDIISSYLSVVKKGRNHAAVCPFHDDHSPSLIISSERQIFNCFTCRTGGNVFAFVMKYENVSFIEAVKIIAKKVGYDLNIKDEEVTDKPKRIDYEIMDYSAKFYLNNLFTEEGTLARKYLSERGINDDIIREFNIGLSPKEKDTLVTISNKKGWDIDTLDNLGLINKVGINIYDAFTNRIMIPISNMQGDVVGFTGRIFNNEDTAKYLNTRETEIFKKSHILFNYHNARNYIREKKQVIIVEGNMDAIKMSASGIKNVVALMGVALSHEQIDMIKKLRVPVVLMLDNDNAGRDATVGVGEALMNAGIDTYVVRLSEAKDPDEYIRLKGVDNLLELIKRAHKYIEFKLEYLKNNKNLNNIEDIILYVKEVIGALSNQDDLTKEVVISKISTDYKIDPEIIKRELGSKNETPTVREVVVKNDVKVSKYHKLSRKILYYMMVDEKYISIYKTKLGYFKDRIERVLASEIVYYQNTNGSINVADFTTYIMENESVCDIINDILSLYVDLECNMADFLESINALLNIYKLEKKDELKRKIKEELDINKKLELINELAEMKKEV